MSLESDLSTLLQTNTALTALVGTRFQYASDPQDLALPKVTIAKIQSTDFYSNDGPIGMVNALLQIDCVSLQLNQAKAVAAQVKGTLRGFSGTTGATTIGMISMSDERDIPEPLDAGREKPWQKVVLAFLVSFFD